MARLGRVLGILVGAVLLGLLVYGPGWARATTERIISFDSHIVIHPDASMTVNERITVVSAGQEIKRGIVREFPTTYRDRYGNTVRVGFEILEVRRDGRPEPYHTEKVSKGVKIFIGQREVIIPPGQYTYSITYKTDRQLGYFQDYDELYWNVTGNGWTFAIDRARAEVKLPPGAAIRQMAAYTGPIGSREQNFRINQTGADHIVFATTRGLAPREGLTIAVAWPKGFVRQPSAGEETWSYLRDNISAAIAVLGFLTLLGYYLMVWRRVGRDPQRGTIIPRFAPPPGFSPAAVRFLMRLGFDAKTFAAAVLDMAVKGYYRIREADGVFVLEKQGRGDLSREEEQLGRDLFAASQSLIIGQAQQPTIATAQKNLKHSLERMLTTIYFKTNRRYLGPAVAISVMMAAALIMTAADQAAAAACLLFYLVTGVLLSVIYVQWAGSGWFLRIFLTIFGAIWFLSTVIIMPAEVFQSAAVSIALAGVIFLHLVFWRLLQAPTLKGREVMDQIEGFRMYLGVAEKERLALLHPPPQTPELFEKYLPYALALDVENEWSEQFAEVLAKAATAEQPYTPTWYQGRSWSSQSLAGFATGLGSSLSDAISAAATPPGSSSGSGGGGSSGGGGGGGGGSGW